jgi:hypothetical protein
MAARKAAIEARKAAFAKAKANKAATQEVMTAQEVTPTPQPTAELSSSSAEASSKLCAGGSSLAQWCSSARVSNKVSTFTLSTPTLHSSLWLCISIVLLFNPLNAPVARQDILRKLSVQRANKVCSRHTSLNGSFSRLLKLLFKVLIVRFCHSTEMLRLSEQRQHVGVR